MVRFLLRPALRKNQNFDARARQNPEVANTPLPPLPKFSGWGMTTQTLPPWENSPDSVSRIVMELHSNFKDKLSAHEFKLSMFQEVEKLPEHMDQFLWREYVIVVSVLLATKSKAPKEKFSLVEGGVCDGWGAWFAMKTAATHFPDYQYWAYDSWAAMKSDQLLPSEKNRIGAYGYLDFDQVCANLSEFDDRVQFCRGFLPESLSEHDGPPDVHWLHIDLNAALPSEAMISHFWDRIPEGGVVLLDDYSWELHIEMKALIDKFLQSRGNWAIALPTGQGLVIKTW